MTERETEHQRLVAAFHNTFETTSGKIVLEKLSKYCLEKESTFDPNPYQAALNEGARTVILYIRRILDQKVEENKQEQAVN